MRAKITDFGLARLAESGTGLTQDTVLAGTPTYMSPEQAGHSDLDYRSDIYSLGVTLYEVLTGEVPFRGAPHMVFQQVLGEEPRSPRLLNDKILPISKRSASKPWPRNPAGAIRPPATRRRPEPTGCGASRSTHGRWAAWNGAGDGAGAGRWLPAWRWRYVLVIVAGVAGISWKWAEAVSERRRTERERDHALRNFRQAREAVDTYLTQVSDNDVLKAQNLEPLRRELLRTARDFYERFVQQDPDDPNLQAELGKSPRAVGADHVRPGVQTQGPRALSENGGDFRSPS